MEIRTLLEADAAAWWNVRREALELEPFAFGMALEDHLKTPVETIATRLRGTSPDYFAVGAFENGALVGIATFVRDMGLKERHKAHIYGVYVTTAQRGKGIGRRLIAGILERVSQDPSLEQILLAVTANQESARRLYNRLGFEKWGTEPRALKIDGQYVDEDYMILRLH